MTRRVFALAMMFILAMPVAGVGGQSNAPDGRRIDSLFAQYTRGTTPGASVAVVRDGKILFSKGYGFANLEHRAPITPATVFDVASVSKQFAGLAVAMLVTEGRVKLTDDIVHPGDGRCRAYDHRRPPRASHERAAGLARHAVARGMAHGRHVAFDQILRMAYNQRSLNFVPGAEYTYSNTGYNLLAEMVARVTGKSFREWTDENLFRPLRHDELALPRRSQPHRPKSRIRVRPAPGQHVLGRHEQPDGAGIELALQYGRGPREVGDELR